MLDSSQAVKDQINAPSRRIVGRVTFGISDVTAYGDIEEIIGAASTSYCNPSQVVNLKRDPSYKLATYEDNYFSLDGTVSFPDSDFSQNGETGYISNALCGSNSKWATPYVGRVMNGSVPVPNTVFSIQNTVTGTWYDFTTDSAGNFRFDYDMHGQVVPDGTYSSAGVQIGATWYNNPQVFTLLGGYVGVEGEFVLNADGTKMTNYPQSAPYVSVSFGSPHSSPGITVAFDNLLGEFATQFYVNAYDSVGALITSVKITDNTQTVVKAIGQLYNYQKIEVIVTEWCKPYRRGRIVEVDFGIVQTYTGDDGLIRFNIVEDLDLTSGQVPSAELTFEVDNLDRAFNILNPNGFYKYLQERQIVNVDFGVEVVNGTVIYFPAGKYYLSEWTSNEGSMTASFTARTALDLMIAFSFEQLEPLNQSLFELAQNIADICGVTFAYLDPSLNTIQTNSLTKKIDCRSALQMVAVAGCCNIIINRDGNIEIIKTDTVGNTLDYIDFDNIYEEPKIKQDKMISSVEVKYFTDLDNSLSSFAYSGSAGDALTLDGNTFINDSTRATMVANWILFQRNGRRLEYTVNFRGNPLHELGDVIEIENSYGSTQQAIITKQEITYEGYLHSTTEAKGVSS